MRIWIDGDACPNKIKQILYRAAIRTKINLIIVANHFLSIPSSPLIKSIKVNSGFDVADNEILNNIQAGDLVVTADIPLAHAIIEKKAIALNPRGTLYSERNIKQILAARNLNESLRSSGLVWSTVPTLSPTEIQSFSNNLDKIISKNSPST